MGRKADENEFDYMGYEKEVIGIFHRGRITEKIKSSINKTCKNKTDGGKQCPAETITESEKRIAG